MRLQSIGRSPGNKYVRQAAICFFRGSFRGDNGLADICLFYFFGARRNNWRRAFRRHDTRLESGGGRPGQFRFYFPPSIRRGFRRIGFVSAVVRTCSLGRGVCFFAKQENLAAGCLAAAVLFVRISMGTPAITVLLGSVSVRGSFMRVVLHVPGKRVSARNGGVTRRDRSGVCCRDFFSRETGRPYRKPLPG